MYFGGVTLCRGMDIVNVGQEEIHLDAEFDLLPTTLANKNNCLSWCNTCLRPRIYFIYFVPYNNLSS